MAYKLSKEQRQAFEKQILTAFDEKVAATTDISKAERLKATAARKSLLEFQSSVRAPGGGMLRGIPNRLADQQELDERLTAFARQMAVAEAKEQLGIELSRTEHRKLIRDREMYRKMYAAMQQALADHMDELVNEGSRMREDVMALARAAQAEGRTDALGRCEKALLDINETCRTAGTLYEAVEHSHTEQPLPQGCLDRGRTFVIKEFSYTKNQKKMLLDVAKKRAQQQGLEEKARAQRQTLEGLSPRARRNALRRAEKYEIRANAFKVRAKQLEERANGRINDKEWRRIARSRRNHWFYDRISAVVTAFRLRNPLREEGMAFDRTMTDGQQKHFENKGRIFLGGTKAMNRFVDEQGRDWLCKEAVTCVGTKKPMGALVTEAASKLQELLCPEAAVRSFVYRGEKGEVLGSLQERLDISSDAFDLFKWQTDTSQPLPEGLLPQILREHVTDWLLCNFDTKGENFLVDANGVLRGIDKEQALSYVEKDETQQMSYTYSPNPNKTLYNTIFEMHVKGEMTLDFSAVKPFVERAEAISREDYEAIFRPVVETRCQGDRARADKMMDKILARKDGLAAEYERFFGQLERDRERTLGLPQRQEETVVSVTEAEGKSMTAPTRIPLDLSQHMAKAKTSGTKEKTAPQRAKEKDEIQLGD